MKTQSKKSPRVTAFLTTSVVTSLLALSCFGAMGCAKVEASVSTSDLASPVGAAPLMPSSHDGRFESLGAPGCYGCHGANETANPMLATAVPLPPNHYQDSDVSTYTIDPVRAQCNTCHSVDQGAAAASDAGAEADASSNS